MSVEEIFKDSNVKLQYRIIVEIEKVKNGNSTKNLSQLESILKELMMISETKHLPLKYPRYIVDSWEYTDELGIELLNLEELYKRWI